MTGNAKRISTLHIADDIEYLGHLYSALGFSKIETDTPDCIGWLSPDGSGIILSTVAMISRDYGAETAQDLNGKSIPYIHVQSLNTAQDNIKNASMTARKTFSLSAVKEVLVQTPEKTFMLAETTA